jgi:hypothetical protein
MANELEITQNKLSNALSSSLNSASAIITKDYLAKLETYEILVPSEEDIDINIADCGKFYKLTKLVVNREENFLNKLTTIVNVASSIDCTLTTIIKSDGFQIEYYFGILSKKCRGQKENSVKRRKANAKAFEGALLGNLVGSDFKVVSEKEVDDFREHVLSKRGNCYSSVSGIVALRDDEDKSVEGYVQGIENLVDSLKGQQYTIVMIADPVDTTQIQVIKQGYEILHTQLSTFARGMVTIHESDTLSFSKSRTDGIAEGISKGISMTQTKTQSQGESRGVSASLSLGIQHIVNANVGINTGKSSGVANTSGKTDTTTQTKQKNKAVTDTSSNSETTGKSLQLNYENRAVKALLDKIDKHLERLEECESFGAFDCATYVIAQDRETTLTVASNYNALMRGKNSSVQASHINSWFREEETAILGRYMGALVHPRFLQNQENGIIVTPSSIISGDELAIQIGLPKKSISGVTVIPMASFGRNVMNTGKDFMILGNLYHMGHDEGTENHKQKVSIDIESLSMHTFVTGSTGAGKSTVIYSILDKLKRHTVKGTVNEKTKFMVIEPAKGEYKDRFGKDADVFVYGTNDKKMPLLRMNPFSFPEDVHVLEHIDRLIEIFNVCWPMYAAMPAILKDAIERAYVVAGWNLETSECRYESLIGVRFYPTFIDLLSQVMNVMEESSYSSDSKSDYKGALCTRLKSLTNGLYKQIFTSNELSCEELFERNVIIDLSRIGSSETKSLIMGLLVMKLQEYRMANAKGGNAPLKHVTVLEEAHNILKRTSTEQSSESANLIGKSVEMLANSIAQMRTYGEGFIIVDQAPALLDLSVIRNTNTKIILRLPDLGDRELVGRAANLNDEQILELSRLKTFVAAVYQNNWLEPVLCNLDTNFKESVPYQYTPPTKIVDERMKYLEFLLLPINLRTKMGEKRILELIEGVFKLQIPVESKIAFIRYAKTTDKKEIQSLREQVVYQFFNSETAFQYAKSKESVIDDWYRSMLDVLEPNIECLAPYDQQKIIALLTKQKSKLEKNQEALFERLIDYL